MTQDVALVEAHVSVADPETGERIARELVDRGLAACVQCLGPIGSVYRWQDETHRSQEWLLLIKTTAAAFPAVCSAVQQLHGYDVPEVIAVPVTHALEPYAAWVRNNSTGARSSTE